MQFTYHAEAKNEIIKLENDSFKHLIKARRHKVGQEIAFRNLEDEFLYFYEIETIDRRSALLKLKSSKHNIVRPNKILHIAWCIVDPKTVEKELSYLNELGVAKITFIPCEYSQNNFKLNFEKMNKILLNSSQQCGRSSLIQFEVFNSLDEYLKSYPNAYMFNFSPQHVDEVNGIEYIVVGCEGGFSQREIALFSEKQIVGIDSNLILRSETAVTTLAAKLIV